MRTKHKYNESDFLLPQITLPFQSYSIPVVENKRIFSGLCTMLKEISTDLEYESLFLNWKTFFHLNLTCILYFFGLISRFSS